MMHLKEGNCWFLKNCYDRKLAEFLYIYNFGIFKVLFLNSYRWISYYLRVIEDDLGPPQVGVLEWGMKNISGREKHEQCKDGMGLEHGY